ncbi:MAG: hypothetical protein KC561_12385, partial [Myxococcales bacterium]|nr:hypothetical protein [Myxococcales bacterium]
SKTRDTIERYVRKLGDQLDRATLHHDEERLSALRSALSWMHPGGNPQERTLGVDSIAAIVGWEEVSRRIVEVADPLHPPECEVAL